ncbi:MAG: hypothetical protein PHZ26_01970 [Candidatus Gracilibacteria bacterium]|nr:hypothetical protein [Candidatus Gracilibacteria bacterium]MDD2908501.1 hypothetical protein [Candidatus Gracilibacteria bacterium]
MDKITYLQNVISDLEDNSKFKMIFSILQSENMITDELIDKMIAELDAFSKELLNNINQMKSFLENLKTKEILDRKKEIEELLKFNTGLEDYI